MLAVVDISECPKKFETFISGTSFPISILANVCHYGIIMTNGKNLYFQGVSAFVVVNSIPFPKLKDSKKNDEKRRLLR